ncbi:MAG: putative bifunctional diguanylate cyclase/phosphodiesterase [Actinomycetes bacterium]
MVRLPLQDPRVWLVSGLLAATGGALWWTGPQLPALEPHLPLLLLAVLFALTERFVVHLPIGRESHTLTFNELPLALGLLFATTDELVLAALTGVAVTIGLVYRRPPIKLVFNLSSTLLQTALAATLFSLLLDALGTGPLDPLGWLALLVTALVVNAISGLAVFAVIWLRRSEGDGRSLARRLVYGSIATLVVTDLGLVTALILRRETPAIVLLAVMAALCFALYRGYHVQRLRYGRLELLYQFTRSVDASLQDETVLETVKREARELLRAKHAQVMVCPDPDASRVRGGAPQWWAAACDGEVVRREVGRRGEPNEALRGSGHLDAMAAPLRDGGRISGVLVVADRLDDVSTFDDEDARLFEALAGHASVALSNSGLVERVRAAALETEHLALHDPLTGLPNRLHFQQRLERRLLATGSAAVLLMDVDRFKEVNDTLGHDVGDQLLQLVGHRLSRLEHDETVVARLGGDEFAILLGDDDVHVEGMVARIARDFSRPFDVGDVKLDVTASVGIAMAPRDGASAALLLRRAEVAMYDAKRRLTGVASYSAERDPYSARRLSLISDLTRALEEDTLEVHYQPQAEPTTGRVTGVEALLRWKHPVWGQVPPDEFVPLAEHTGLIRPLTQFVTETAVNQCATWRDAGTPVTVAVNISMRNLLETDLADVVARLLVKAGLPARLLKLEVTESAIVSDPERAVGALQRLVELGLSVSVDDFGTGYSSLTRLRNLPVHEVKIDRAFVHNLADSADDLAIVRAVISLGHELGLHVVAEGVEDERTWRILEDLECDLLQGHLLARPMPADDMTRWLREHFAGFATRLHHEPVGLTAPGAPAADPRTWTRRTGGGPGS